MNQTKTIRKKIKEFDLLPGLIDKYRGDSSLTLDESLFLWVGLNDLSMRLANRHYKEKQYNINYDWLNPVESEQGHKQYIRVFFTYDFIKEYKAGVCAKGVLFALHRRYPYLEMLVECKYYGLDILPGKGLHKRINSRPIKDIMIACQIYRSIPIKQATYKEILLRYVHGRIEEGKTITYQDVSRFIQNTTPYFKAKNIKYSVEFMEALYRPDKYISSL